MMVSPTTQGPRVNGAAESPPIGGDSGVCGLTSQPFAAPQPPNNVAVKIITRTGAEMTTSLRP